MKEPRNSAYHYNAHVSKFKLSMIRLPETLKMGISWKLFNTRY